MLYIAGGSRSLISEAVRGEGAWLVDRHGYRFMTDYDPRGELAPRDVVSLAIVSQMEKTRHPNVYLDLNHLDPARGQARFPEHRRRVRRVQSGHHPRPDPGAAGGTLHDGRRHGGPRRPHDAARLWAAGEVTASGLHGANRLATNSLLEAMVFGLHAGEGASRAAAELHDDFAASRDREPAATTPPPSR